MSRENMLSTTMSIYILGTVALGSLLFLIPVMNLGTEVASYYSNFTQIFSSIVATILCLRTAAIFERGDPMRMVWMLMGAGVLSWGMGEMLYTGYIITYNGAEPPYIWYSDIGFLLIYPLIVAAIFVFIQAMGIHPPNWGVALALLVLIIAAVTAYDSAKENLYEATTTMEFLAVLAYILFDPILLAVTLLGASILTGGLLARPWWFCFAGLILHYASNRIFEIQSAQDTYVSGSWVDLGWTLSFVLVGVAAQLVYELLEPAG